MTSLPDDFAGHYGPWALVVGGSDGLGAAFADELAAAGINLVLVARNQAKLDATATALRGAHGVEIRCHSIDLEDQNAADALAQVTADIDLGFVLFNAGADTSGARFIEQPLSFWDGIIRRNITTLTAALHHFGGRLAKSGRGGMLIVGSEAAYGGGGRVGIYSATKGYALNLGESLWAELKPHHVDVLNLVFAIADTPSLRSVLDAHHISVEATGATDPVDLARAALAHMKQGPTFVWQSDETSTDSLKSPAVRRQRAQTTTDMMNMFYTGVPQG